MLDETTAETIIMWALTGAAVVIMLARVGLRLGRNRKLELGEFFTLAAIIALLVRSSVEHVVMAWGSNTTVTAKQRATHHFTAAEIYRIETASKLLIVNRVMYTVYVWLQKAVVMMLLERLMRGLRFDKILTGSWLVLGLTVIPGIVMCLTECRPIQKYWQVFPDPGKCANGNLQLLVFEIFNMVTDVMIMILPLGHLWKIQRPLMAKLRLISLFMVGLTLVAISLIRVMGNFFKFHRTGNSHDVANVELFFAAVIANAPTIYGLINMKYGPGSSKQSYGRSGPGGSGYMRNSFTREADRSQLDATATSTLSVKSSKHGLWAQKNGDFESDEELIFEMPDRPLSYKTKDIRVTKTFNVD